MSRVLLGWGAPGNGKSTFAISGEGKTWYCETDPGSFDRAKGAMDTSGVVYYQCHPPIDDILKEIMDEGVLNTSMVGKTKDGDLNPEGKGAVQVVHHLTGWNEQLRALREAYTKALLDPDVRTVVFDTAAQLWVLIQNAFKQRIQNETEVERVRLTRLEFEDNNQTMMKFVMGAKVQKKDIVFIAREREKYVAGAPTGIIIPSGWGESQAQADLEMQFSIEGQKPVATIRKAGGADTAMIGMKIPEPTIPMVNALLDAATVLRNHKLVLPKTITEIMEMSQDQKLLQAAHAIKTMGLPMPTDRAAIIEQGQALGAR